MDESHGARSGQARRLNRARAEIAEGRLGDAKASLAEAERRRPGWGKTAFFRAIVSKDEGRLEDAERDLKAVLEKFSLDRVAWNNLGLIYWLAGKFPEAIAAYGKTLAIDPEDLNAHYNLMRVYRATSNRRNAEIHDAAYRKYKDDEAIRAIPGNFRPSRTRGPTASRFPSTSTPRLCLPAGVRRRLGRLDRAEGLRNRQRIPHARILPVPSEQDRRPRDGAQGRRSARRTAHLLGPLRPRDPLGVPGCFARFPKGQSRLHESPASPGRMLREFCRSMRQPTCASN